MIITKSLILTGTGLMEFEAFGSLLSGQLRLRPGSRQSMQMLFCRCSKRNIKQFNT